MLLNDQTESDFISSLSGRCVWSSQGQAGGSSATVWRRRFDFSIFPISSSILSIFVLQRPLRGSNLREREVFSSERLYQKKYTDCSVLCPLLNEGILS